MLASVGLWADTEYKLINYSLETPALTGDIINTTSISAFGSGKEITFTEADESTTTLSHYVAATNKTVSGQTANDGHFVYDLKTTSADIKIYAYNKNSSKKAIYVSLLSECEQKNETIDANSKVAQIISKSVTCTDGGTRVVISGNSGDVQFAQIIITEKGSALKSFGEAGYTLTGKRVAVKDKSNGVYGELQIVSSSDVKYMNEDICKPTVSSNAPSGYIKFTTPDNGEKVVLKVTHSSSKAVVVDAISSLPANVSGYTQLTTAVTETTKVLNPNTTYMIFSINSTPSINKIEFEEYVESTDATLSEITVAGNALDMSKFAEKDGALQYDYELPMNTTEVPAVTYTLNDETASAVKTDAADVNGTTTIVVTAEDGITTKTYKINFSVKSALGTDATLSSIKLDGVEIDGFDAATIEYNVEIGVYATLPTITYTLNDLNATAEFTAATAVPGSATIVVTAEDGTTENTYTINFTRATATALASINDNTTWDFTKTGSTEVKFTASTNPQKDVEFNFADVLNNPDASFNASALIGAGEFAVRGGDYFQGNYVKFNTTVAGTMTVVYSNTSDRSKGDGETEGQESQRRFLTVNDALVSGDAGTMKQAKANATTVSNIPVAAGNVKIGAVRPYYTDHTTDAQYLRIYSIVFTKSPATALDNAADEVKAVKRIENGQLFIEKNGVIYNAQGAVVR